MNKASVHAMKQLAAQVDEAWNDWRGCQTGELPGTERPERVQDG
jgi:hypothetical protein